MTVKFGLYIIESLSSAKHLTERNIRLKFNKIPYSLSVALTLGLHCQVVGSTHCLTQMNIWLKFNEIRDRVKEIQSGHRIHGLIPCH